MTHLGLDLILHWQGTSITAILAQPVFIYINKHSKDD
jgi:hypothetical protein